MPEFLERFIENANIRVDIDIEIKNAVKVLQGKLEPLERAVYLLKEVFDFDYDAIHEILDKKKDNCRQLFCRARKKLHTDHIKINVAIPQPKLFDSIKKAFDRGNISDLIADLKSDLSGSEENVK